MMHYYFFNILHWIMLDNTWDFSITVQGHHIYKRRCNTSLAEKFIRKQENAFIGPHSSGTQRRGLAKITLERKGRSGRKAELFDPQDRDAKIPNLQRTPPSLKRARCPGLLPWSLPLPSGPARKTAAPPLRL